MKQRIKSSVRRNRKAMIRHGINVTRFDGYAKVYPLYSRNELINYTNNEEGD